MDKRAQILLKTLVEHYISDGQPIGSRTLLPVSYTHLLAKRFYQYKTQTVLSFKWLPITAFVATILVHMGFALDSYTTTQLNVVAESVPFYQTVSARSFFSSLGFKTQRDTKLKVKGKLNYPLNPIHFQQPAKPYNIIWLTSESLRADMLDEKIMPNSWAFAKNAARFTRNYSTGNGTRIDVYKRQRAPSAKDSASINIDLPAPVSPVSTV